jgi:hypothetical protein
LFTNFVGKVEINQNGNLIGLVRLIQQNVFRLEDSSPANGCRAFTVCQLLRIWRKKSGIPLKINPQITNCLFDLGSKLSFSR